MRVWWALDFNNYKVILIIVMMILTYGGQWLAAIVYPSPAMHCCCCCFLLPKPRFCDAIKKVAVNSPRFRPHSLRFFSRTASGPCYKPTLQQRSILLRKFTYSIGCWLAHPQFGNLFQVFLFVSAPPNHSAHTSVWWCIDSSRNCSAWDR